MSTLLLFMGLGTQEVIIILFLVLLLFGAKKIPELAKGLGKGIREFKDATTNVRSDIMDSATTTTTAPPVTTPVEHATTTTATP